MSDVNISIETMQAMLAEETDRVMLALAKFIHDDLTEDIRLVSNTVDLTFDEGFGEGDQLWTALPFEISLPHDIEGQIPTVALKVDNVHRTIVEAIRTISSPPIVEISIVAVSSAGVITREIGPMSFRLNLVDYDVFAVNGTLGYQADYLNEPAIQHSMDPTMFPGLFS